MKRKCSLILFFLTIAMTFVLGGCAGKDETEGKNEYSVYYLNRAETKIEAFAYYTATEDTMDLLGELIEVIATAPKDVNYHEPVHSFEITGYALNDNQVSLNVDEKYLEMSPTTEVLTRAAIVRTLTQMKGIDYVTMKVRDEDLKDSMGNPVGTMSADQFVDNAGNEINTYEKARLTLYFSNEKGDRLIKANRTVVYNSNISMEKLVVEQLVAGPQSGEIYATVNPDTKVINVTVKDGTCYVNLSEEFLTQFSAVTPDVTIYSIVNSLVELSNVNRVQISINGETDTVFRETYNLSTVFERNLDIL